MTLTDCQLLSIVAQLGTFAAAAERLHITPSAVSHAVSGVEAECGFPLFTRTKSGVTLTAAAEKLMPAIQQMLASSESLDQSIAQINGMHKGALRLGVFNSACVTWLPKIVPGFRAAFPGIDVQIYQGSYDDITGWLKTGAVELGFLSNSSAHDLDFEPLYDDRLICIAPPDYQPRRPGVVRAEELRSQPFVSQQSDVDADIQHDLTGAHALRADHTGLTGGDDEDVGLAADVGQILAAAVADGHGRMLGEQQQRDRLADDKAAADDDDALAFDGDVVVLEQRHAGRGGAGGITALGAGVHGGHGAVGDAVHVLFRVERRARRLVIQVPRQRAEHQHAVDLLVRAQRVDVLHQHLLRHILRQDDLTDGDADLFAALERTALVGQVILTRADAQDGEAWLYAVFLQFFRLCMELLGQRLGDLGSLEQHSHGKNSSSDRRGHPRSYP